MTGVPLVLLKPGEWLFFDFQNWERCGVLLGNSLLFIRHPLSLCVLSEHPLSLGFARCFLGLYLVYLHKLFHSVRGDAVLWQFTRDDVNKVVRRLDKCIRRSNSWHSQYLCRKNTVSQTRVALVEVTYIS